MSKTLHLAVAGGNCDSHPGLADTSAGRYSTKWSPVCYAKDSDASENSPTPIPCCRKSAWSCCGKDPGFPVIAKWKASSFSLTSKKRESGAFHLTELTGQTIPVAIKKFNVNQNHPARSVKSLQKWARRDGFKAKTLGKSLIHFQNDWSGIGPATKF